MSQGIPRIGSIWRNKKTQTYKVLMIANATSPRPDLHPITVIYTDEFGRIWSDPVNWWYGVMTLLIEV